MSARNSGIRQITALDCAKCRENRPYVLISQILINKLRILSMSSSLKTLFNGGKMYAIPAIKNTYLSTLQHRKQHQIKLWILDKTQV